MIKELSVDRIFIFGNSIEIILDKKKSSLKSGIIKNFISRNFSCSEHASRVFISLNEFLNLKEFRMFRRREENNCLW